MATIYRNKQLMYLSFLLFLYFSSIGCVFPFLTFHMQQLGFSISEISCINALSAFFSVIGPVLFGSIAERRHRYKSSMSFCILIGALAVVALAFVPRYEKLHYRPLVDFDCKSGLRIERCVNWATCAEALEPNENFTTVKLSDCHYQCPTKGQVSPVYPLHICFHGDTGNVCVVYDGDSDDDSLTDFQSHIHTWRFTEVSSSNFTSENSSVVEDVPRALVSMCNYVPSGTITFGQKTYHSISCRPLLEDCSVHCRVSFASEGVVVLPRSCEEASGNPSVTFWSYLVLRCIADMCMLTTVCLLDAITLWSTVDYEGAYGRLHVWAAFGVSAVAPFSGALLDNYKDMDGRTDFSPSFFMSAAIALFACCTVISLPIQKQKPQSLQRDVSTPTTPSRYHTLELVCFLTILLVLGTQWGIYFTFMPLTMADIGCTSVVTGIYETLLFGFSLPFLLISKNMVRNIGKANLLVFALLFYFTRFAGTTFVTSPWWTLPFALMGSFTLCVMWMTVVAYGQALAPTGYSLTVQYALNILHFGIGRGIGSLSGGTLIASYSQRVLFCGVAIVSAVTAILYLTIYHTTLKKRKKTDFPALLNGSWYPLRDRYPNGDAKAHEPIVGDQDDDSEASPNRRQFNK